MKLKKTAVINYIYIMIYLMLFVGTYYDLNIGKWLLLAISLFNISLLFKFRKSQILVIFYIFTATYWLYLFFYFFLDIPYSTYTSYQNFENSVYILRLQSLFFIILGSLIKAPNRKSKIVHKIKRKNNYIIFSGCMIIMVFINIIGLKGNNIFKMSYGEEAVGSPLLEYYIIFFIIAYIYSKNSKVKDNILILINILYVMNLFAHGLRLVSIQILMMTFILFFDMKFKLKYIILGSTFAFFFVSAWASIRVGYIGDWKEIFGIYDGVLQSNQGDVFQASAVHVGMARDNIFDINYRVKAFIGIFANIILPSNLQVKETLLNQNLGTFSVGGGGLISGYLYVYMGYLGVIIVPAILAYFINKTITSKESNNQVSIIYGIFILITFARWYPYSIFILIKIGFWLILIYKISCIIHLITTGNYRRKNG